MATRTNQRANLIRPLLTACKPFGWSDCGGYEACIIRTSPRDDDCGGGGARYGSASYISPWPLKDDDMGMHAPTLGRESERGYLWDTPRSKRN